MVWSGKRWNVRLLKAPNFRWWHLSHLTFDTLILNRQQENCGVPGSWRTALLSFPCQYFPEMAQTRRAINKTLKWWYDMIHDTWYWYSVMINLGCFCVVSSGFFTCSWVGSLTCQPRMSMVRFKWAQMITTHIQGNPQKLVACQVKLAKGSWFQEIWTALPSRETYQ